MDLTKLTTADKVITASGIGFLISLFLPWYGIEVPFAGDFNNNGTEYFLTGWLPLLLAIAMVAQIFISRFSPDTKLPDPPVPWSRVHLLLGAAIAVLVILRLLIASDNVGDIDVDTELDRKYGMFVATLAAIGLGVGGFLKSHEADTDRGIGGGGSGPATPF